MCEVCTSGVNSEFANSEVVNSEIADPIHARDWKSPNEATAPRESNAKGILLPGDYSSCLSDKTAQKQRGFHVAYGFDVTSYIVGLIVIGIRIASDEKFSYALFHVTSFLFTVAGWVYVFNQVTRFFHSSLREFDTNGPGRIRLAQCSRHSGGRYDSLSSAFDLVYDTLLIFPQPESTSQQVAPAPVAGPSSSHEVLSPSSSCEYSSLPPSPVACSPVNMGDDIELRIAAARTELENIVQAVNSATGEAKVDLDRQERRAEAKLQRLLTEQTNGKLTDVTTSLRLHEHEIGQLKELGKTHTDEIAENRGAIEAVSGRVDSFEERLQFVEALAMQAREQTERIDNELRSQNIILYGCVGTVQDTLEKVTNGKPEFRAAVDRAYFIGGEVGDGAIPFKIHFTKVSVCSAYARWTKTPEFATKVKDVKTGRDQTVLKRAGMSRLAAASDALKAKLPDVYITASSTVLKLDGQKYDAIAFAAPTITLGGVVIDLDHECSSNDMYEPNPSLVAQVGDVEVQGFRKKRGRRSNSQEARRGAGTQRATSNKRNKQRSNKKKPPKTTGTTMPAVSGESDFGVALGVGTRNRHGNNRDLLTVGGLQDRYVREPN